MPVTHKPIPLKLRHLIDELYEYTSTCNPKTPKTVKEAVSLANLKLNQNKMSKKYYDNYLNEIDFLINTFDTTCDCNKVKIDNEKLLKELTSHKRT